MGFWYLKGEKKNKGVEVQIVNWESRIGTEHVLFGSVFLVILGKNEPSIIVYIIRFRF